MLRLTQQAIRPHGIVTPVRAATRLLEHAAWMRSGWIGVIFTAEPRQASALSRHLITGFSAMKRGLVGVSPKTPARLPAIADGLLTSPRLRTPSVWLGALHGGVAWEAAWIDLILRLNAQRDGVRQPRRMVLLVAPLRLDATLRAAAPGLFDAQTPTLELGDTQSALANESDTGALDELAVERVFSAAVQSGLADPGRRGLLLACVPSGVATELPLMRHPETQLRSDLLHLNQARATTPRPPLAIWLENAELLTTIYPEAPEIFRAARSRIEAG